MLFRLGRRFYDLARPGDFLRFPMGLADKARFARMMLRAFRKRDWTDWHDRSAEELIDRWAGPGVRERIFEPLARLKFDLPCREVSGAWMGARLHFREGSAPLGYIPGCNWTAVLCSGVARLMEEAGVRVRLRSRVRAIEVEAGRATGAVLEDGERVGADLFVSTVPTEVYRKLVPGDETPGLAAIRYTAVLSAICATRQRVEPDFYWMNLASLDRQAGGLFRLESLNPTIGGPGEACLNFVTHVPDRGRPLFRASDDEIWSGYRDDWREIFGCELEPTWTRLTRLPLYSPVFGKGYANPPVRSASWPNVYFAGNYRTFPSIASTGTALESGLEAAAAVVRDRGMDDDPREAVRRFRLRSMPRA